MQYVLYLIGRLCILCNQAFSLAIFIGLALMVLAAPYCLYKTLSDPNGLMPLKVHEITLILFGVFMIFILHHKPFQRFKKRIGGLF